MSQEKRLKKKPQKTRDKHIGKQSGKKITQN